MKGRPVFGEINYIRLAEMTENFVASDIAYVVNDAATRAFEDDVEITQSLLEEVIKENNPSVSPIDLKFYEDIKKKWRCQMLNLNGGESVLLLMITK